ncbi:unnamed protein product [Caenorhabditis brenneri]
MNDYGVPYDYGSIMHHRADPKGNGNIVVLPFDPNYVMTIGQEETLSYRDIKRMNLAYCSSKCSNMLNCNNGGYVDPNNCNQCFMYYGLHQLQCGPGYVTVNFNSDLTKSGVHVCSWTGPPNLPSSVSESDQMIVIYRLASSQFTIQYSIY